ncbi:hypothetical protein D3C78_1443480 [compost metagenome]
MSDLNILFPEPVVVEVQGRRVLVRPVTLRNFERFASAASGLIGMLGTESAANLYAYARQSGALQAVLGSCTSLSRWRIAGLPASVAVQLMVAVIRINSGFFDQALVKAAAALAGAKSPSA